MANNEAVAKMQHLDPHERPPINIRNVYKKYQKMKLKELDQDQEIIDLSCDTSASSNGKVRVVKEYAAEDLIATFRAFAGEDAKLEDIRVSSSTPVYEHENMPGTVFYLVSMIISSISLEPRNYYFLYVVLIKGRSPHHPLPPPPRSPNPPPIPAPPSRPLQPRSPNQHPHALQHLVPKLVNPS
jgi:hypothetical protein